MKPVFFNAFLFAALFFSLLIPALPASAQQQQSFAPNMLLGDGKDGRPWGQWRQGVTEAPVVSVSAVVSKRSGGPDTFLNLRYGDGQAFENGRQMFLRDNNTTTVSWNVGGTPPNGQPLVLNAYNGAVQLSAVTVRYAGAPASTGSSIPPVQWPHPAVVNPPQQQVPNVQGSGGEAQALERCRRIRIRRPRIEVGEVRQSGGLFSGKYRIKGSMSGMCIEEAGYFENGRLREEVELPLSDTFTRRDFSVKATSGQNGQLRIYTVDGREDIVDVDELIRQSGR